MQRGVNVSLIENSIEMEGDSSIIEAPWKQPNMIMEEKLDLIVFG